ncbi:MAG: glycoside hydrolase family 3 N-terminal domain-containing protein [Bacteroidota bacterium]
MNPMLRLLKLATLIALLACLPFSSFAQTDDEIERRIDDLMSKMSLEEKIGQTALRGTSSRVKGALPQKLKDAVARGEIGAFLNVMKPEYVDELQKIAIEQSPNGIPLIFARDIIHGFKTIFPIPLGMAASFDTEVAKNAARVSAIEGSSIGIRWTFAPMVDIARDARWGRIAESSGEDPYLGSLMSEAYVEGFQGDDLTDPTSMAACAKHFLGYGAAEGGRDYNTAVISDPLMRNVYLPPFQAAIDAGVLTFMSSFNEVNGEPVSGSKYLMKEILRWNMGFNGFVVSDWNSVIEMIPHGYAADEKQAAELSVKAGLDMEMTSAAYDNHIKELLAEGKISLGELNFLVRNILRVKMKMGVFETPMRDPAIQPNFYAEENLELAKQAATKSMVMLKNDKLLPLGEGMDIALIGPLANEGREQLGTWSFDGEKDPSVTPFEAMEGDISGFSRGLAYSRSYEKTYFKEAVKVAKKSDVVVFVGGEEAILSGEAHSRANIDLPGAQVELIKEIAKTGKPIVLVIMAGRPISIMNVIEEVDAVMMAWHPGTMAGPALKDVLMGMAEPGGRLPVSWPKSGAQAPIYYNHKNTGRPASQESFVQIDDIPVGAWQSSLGNNSHYLDLGFTPHFPFGYGLGYTTFSYSDIEITSQEMSRGGSVTVSATIKNTGNRKGKEVVQLYIQDVVASLTRPVRELKGFKAIELEAGASQKVNFTIVADDLKFFNRTGNKVLEAGIFKVWIAPNAAEGLTTSFELK